MSQQPTTELPDSVVTALTSSAVAVRFPPSTNNAEVRSELPTTNEAPELIEIPQKQDESDRDLESLSFFHGAIPRVEAQTALERNESYLVRRMIVEQKTVYALSFKWADRWDEVAIRQAADASDRFYIHDYCARSISSLIEWHCTSRTPVNSTGTRITFAVPRTDWRLRPEQVLIGKQIGQGEFGYVHEAQIVRLNRRAQAAVVKIAKSKVSSVERYRLLREAHMMLGLKHPNIIRIYGICSDDQNMAIVLEMAKGGTLLDRLKKRPPSTRAQKIGFAIDCMEGMHYLFGEHIIHRDLAARNCLLDQSSVLKVADFGLSLSGSKSLSAEGKIATRWAAPEVLTRRVYSAKSDCWSYGVVLFECFSDGDKPGSEWKRREVDEWIRSGNSWSPPAETPDLYRRIMAACFVHDPLKRCSFAQIRDAIRLGDPTRLSVSDRHSKQTG